MTEQHRIGSLKNVVESLVKRRNARTSKLDQPSDEDIEVAYRHFTTMKAIEEMDPISDDEIEAAAKHLAVLQAIEKAA